MRLLYFADIRFPLERANGIQTMETCYALAERGHDVRLVVKPDTHTPARDPFEFYGLPKLASLVIERANTPPGRGDPPAGRLHVVRVRTRLRQRRVRTSSSRGTSELRRRF